MAKKRKITFTDRQRRFVDAFMECTTPGAAVIKAGYNCKPENASRMGYELLEKSHIRDEINRLREERSKALMIDGFYVLSSLKEVVERSLQRAPVFDMRGRQVQDDDGNDLWKYDSQGANKALELIGKHLQLFNDKRIARLDDKDPIDDIFAILDGAEAADDG